jgi:hypothetical protein
VREGGREGGREGQRKQTRSTRLRGPCRPEKQLLTDLVLAALDVLELVLVRDVAHGAKTSKATRTLPLRGVGREGGKEGRREGGKVGGRDGERDRGGGE